MTASQPMPDAHGILLALHIVAGAAGLLLGPAAMLEERDEPRRSTAGLAYASSVIATAVTALALVAADPAALWWLVPLALLTTGLAILSRPAPRWSGRSRALACAHGQGGSYIALVTAALVVSLDGSAEVAAWIAPTAIGLPLIARRVRRLTSRGATASALAPAGASAQPAAGRSAAARERAAPPAATARRVTH